jgi:HAE1 family hydrophobic/amphiphilic exporter-1
MFSRIFIERPILASVISIVIVIAGMVTLFTLPIAQYPEITPPTVSVTTSYPGASAQVLAETVASPIEQEVNGVEGMIYMMSQSASDGSYSLTVTFEVGTDVDMAQILVQNRVATALPKLPEEVKRQGVNTKKKSTAFLLLIALTSPDGRYDNLYLSNYATLNIKDEISRIYGAGEVDVYGGKDYSMRIWLDPELLKARDLTTGDVIAAIQEQNVQVAAGQIGQRPAPRGQSFQYTITTLGRLSDVDEFEDIIVKTAAGGRITRVRDVARVELGSADYNLFAELNGSEIGIITVSQLPGANALDVADKVKAAMANISARFPEGLEYSIPYDTTLFVKASIREVFVTLFQVILLVFLVLFVFLQDWRATLIPAITIPVSLIGTFAVMAMLGLSINMLTLFGIVLAIGIVVDDAIVVVENAVRLMDTEGLSPKDAVIKTMEEVSGPVVATTLVLLAVFIPTAFMAGITGQLYRQFALTIATATVFSSVNALTLSPAIGALILRPTPAKKNILFRKFDAVFNRGQGVYDKVVTGLVRRGALAMVLFAALAGATGWGFKSLPTGFIPNEDQGYVIAMALLPDAASVERTEKVVRQMDAIIKATPGVRDWCTLGGYSLLDGTNASNAATMFIIMEPWDERTDPELSQEAILGRLRRAFWGIQEAVCFVFVPPPINGLGNAGGFEMMLQDRSAVGAALLQQMSQELIAAGNGQPGLTALNTTFSAAVPQLYADVDRVKAKTLGIPLSSVFNTLQAYLGSAYVNDFNKFGRTFQVYAQADSQFRLEPRDIKTLEVRNNAGQMIPLGTLLDVQESLGPQTITRYNLYPAANITGEAAPGFSSGQALALMEQMATTKLPASMGYEWTGMSYQEKQVGGEAIIIFTLAVVMVYLILAAQYESWSNPTAVILVVPLALLGAVVAVALRGMDNNVYTQIGVVLLIALASKNAILIVEFAREKQDQGLGIVEAAIEAARLRFRPILMTSFTAVLGAVPLLIASGAGAASRQSLGTAVFGGMTAATFFSVLYVPVFYAVIMKLAAKIRPRPTEAVSSAEETSA